MSSRETEAPTRPLSVLTPREFRIVLDVARRIVLVPGADHVAIVHGVDERVSKLPPDTRADLTRLLRVFESAPFRLVFDRRFAWFTRMSEAEQDRALVEWRDSRLKLRRGGYQIMRKLCLLAHYGMRSSWAAVKYPDPAQVGEPYEDSRMGAAE